MERGKAMEGFVHGKHVPEQEGRHADRGNPRRFHRSAKWTKATEGFVHGKLDPSRKRGMPTVETRGVSTGRPSGQRPWKALSTES